MSDCIADGTQTSTLADMTSGQQGQLSYSTFEFYLSEISIYRRINTKRWVKIETTKEHRVDTSLFYMSKEHK